MVIMDESNGNSRSFSGRQLPTISNEGWRRHGEERRRELLNKDKAEGGTSFFINRKCPIQKYFRVSDRVLSQFRDMYQHRKNMEEIYVMGSRLIAFLSVSLPKHPRYHSIEISSLREKSLHDLEWIRKRLEVIALRIDEEQLNRFIMEDLESKKKASETNKDAKPPAIEVSFESEETSSLTDNAHWESFTGWSLEVSDEDVTDADWNVSGAKDVSFDSHEIMEMSSASLPSGLMDDADDPGDVLELESVSSDEEESGDDTFEVSEAIRFKFDTEHDDGIDSSFLRAVKSEEVRYESDSEAVDSWAQDSETSALSLTASPQLPRAYSSGDDKDEERFALEEILMNKVQSKSNSPMRISPAKERLLGIPTRQPGLASPARRLYGADSTPFDEQTTPPSPRKKYERRSVLGIRDDLSPDQENKFSYGPTKTVSAEDVTFEMEGIAPRRRVRTDDHSRKPPAAPRRRSDKTSSMAYLSDDSDSQEELITSQGEIAHPIQPYPFYHSR